MIPDLLTRLDAMAKTANAADAMIMREARDEIELLQANLIMSRAVLRKIAERGKGWEARDAKAVMGEAK